MRFPMTRCTWLGSLFVVVLLWGCGGNNYALVKGDGIHFFRYNYRVNYTVASSQTFVSGAWLLDNFHQDDDGDWIMNKSKRYFGTTQIDRDGDGKYETEEVFLFDLKLNHRRSNAVLWIQNQELDPKTTGKSLETLLANYARSLTGAGFYAESNIFSVMRIKQKRFVASILEKKPVRVGGLKGLTARIRIVNLDQLKVDPKHPGDTVQVTLLKRYFEYPAHQHAYGNLTGHSAMIIGYYNTTPAFGKLLKAYQHLLGRITFGRWTNK